MTRLRWLVATSLRGLWARRVLSLGSLLLTVIAVASAVVGPSYQGRAANSFVISQLAAQPLVNTALTWDYRPTQGQSIDAAISTGLRTSAHISGPDYLPGHAIVWDPLPLVQLPGSSIPSLPRLVSVPGACAHVALRGRCPASPREIAVLATDATTYGVHLGSRFRADQGQPPFTIVGIYRARSQDDGFWFGPQRLQSSPGSSGRQVIPNHPGPWITAQATIALSTHPWYVSLDQALKITPLMTPASVAATAEHVRSLMRDAQREVLSSSTGTGLSLEPGNALAPTVRTFLSRRGVARSTVTPAVLSLILVALVLLSRLLSAAMALRRGELALASLRGYSRRQLWVLGLFEPLLILLAAAPLGIGLGYLTSVRLARQWLFPGLPVPFELLGLVAALAVILVTALVAAVVVRDAVNEPLSAQIAGVRRPGRASRLLVVVRLVLVAAAVAALVTAGSRSTPRAPDATDLALPMLLAIAAGLLSGLLVLALSGLWVRWTARRRAVAPYVASRSVRRRREGTLVILPLTAAMTIAVFAAGVSSAASTWRASSAATEVGAPLSFPTVLPLDRAVGLTHQIDPDGRWLMAAAVTYISTNDASSAILASVVEDTTRLARVATWPSQWTPGQTAADVARMLGPSRPPVTLQGSRLSITVDNQVQGDYGRLGLSLAVLDDNGVPREVNLDPYAAHTTSTHSVRLRACATGCALQTISFGGPAGLVEAMEGTATISGFQVDGQAVPGALDAPWRPAASQVGSPDAVRKQPTLESGRLRVQFGSHDSSSYAGISPTDVPAVVPVLWGRLATQATTLPTGASGSFQVRSAGTSESMPFRGPSGMLIDYTMFARNINQDNTTSSVVIFARSDTPKKVLDALAARGLAHADTQAAARHALDQDAFALALRLYLVVTILVILLAVAGLGANLAVQLPARRRDAASLRVVGVPRRSLIAGVVAEFLVVLGAAALAGVAAGALAQYVVVRTVTLGYADSDVTPRVLPSFNARTAVELSAVVLVVLVVLSTAFAILTVRGARTSSLRENAR